MQLVRWKKLSCGVVSNAYQQYRTHIKAKSTQSPASWQQTNLFSNSLEDIRVSKYTKMSLAAMRWSWAGVGTNHWNYGMLSLNQRIDKLNLWQNLLLLINRNRSWIVWSNYHLIDLWLLIMMDMSLFGKFNSQTCNWCTTHSHSR